ncbi:MAG: hypothetical protein JXR13_00130 [Thalassovita sp.]
MGLISELTTPSGFTSASARLRQIASQSDDDNSDPLSAKAMESRSRSAYRRQASANTVQKTAPLDGKRYICISATPENQVERMVLSMGANVFPVSSLTHAQRVIKETPGTWDGLLVIRDGLMPLDHLVTELLSLRYTLSNVPVLMFSESIQADDLGKSRSAICDASLYLPLTEGRLKMGVEAAEMNNDQNY